MKTGIANLALHHGSAPRWLFERMSNLAREVTTAIVFDYGPEEFLNRISHPYWFQSLGCVLGFDWHSSGLTTTTTGALKSGIRGLEKDLGLWIAGGKGRTSRKTPDEINRVSQDLGKDFSHLVYSSKMSAKVDSAGLQDGFQLYHHNFFFTKNAKWSVVQQGMNPETHFARRYHWISDDLTSFVEEPHKGVASNIKVKPLNLVANKSLECRVLSSELAKERPEKTVAEFTKTLELKLPKREKIAESDIRPENLRKILLSTYERQPENFEQLLSMKGVGPKTIRALALISELIYDAPASREDPVKYSFAHGGKDGTPYPVDRKTYDESIDILKKAVSRAKLGHYEKLHALNRLQASLL